ncbi:Activating transcription factor 7-interacting protein 1 [Tupaia chinensis]|uniref:Activating transcription factor 7-interacting protein 1 n=1 Tax=Tupaia chinensis TaxID=246437 RepID=L8Y1L6_TUPCH|nr:Activating transcription factor 7-interacting protein 1 [Tupaia chinensis]
MRVSDRQQLEAVYKVKEELLKTDVKLLNGNHENGDLDPTSPLENTDYSKDKEEVNGIEEICFDPEESKTECKETPCILTVNVKNKQDADLSCEPLPLNNITPEPSSKLTTEPASGDPLSSDLATGDLASGGLASGDSISGVPTPGDLTSGNSASCDPASGDPASCEPVSGEPFSGERVSGKLSSGDCASDDPASGNLTSGHLASGTQASVDPSSVDPASSELASVDPASGDLPAGELASGELASGELASGELASGEVTSESAFDPTFEPCPVPACEPAAETDNTQLNSNKDDDFLEKNGDDEKLDQIQSKDSFDEKNKADINIDANKETLETDDAIICSDLPPENEKKVEEDTELAFGEEAISSSMEVDHHEKNEEENSADLIETIRENVTKDDKSENILESTDSMETDEIIPILEKLAPAEDELTCFSKTSLLPIDETNPDLEEKMESSFGSPSKQESSESLPKEAFLVLSDEEDISGEKDESEDTSQNEACSPDEFSRRKRSKSEDIDNVHSKRRRYMEEEYEAEFQVKITAKGDINQKLQKVIQWLLEEKLCALQCAVFDKTLAELKTRVEKIECNKRHKTVLTELQAKIARLTKRFGAAKEDLKKRQENPPNPPVSPGKSANEVSSNNSMPYRNAGTVRQMLESKRSVSESAPPSFQTPGNTEFVKCRHFVFQSGKATGNDSGGVIDLTVDEEESGASQGVTVRVPQTTTYVVNNGLTLGSTGPQLTVHHRPPQVHTEPPRPVHPAPLPEAPQPQRLPPEAASTSLPQKPHLKLARVQSQNGIVLSWSVLEVDRSCATVDSYHLYAYHEEPSATVPSQWKKIGEVKALPLPMACTLTQFVSGSKYYFAVRAKDIYGRFGPFCDPQSTDVISSSQSS